MKLNRLRQFLTAVRAAVTDRDQLYLAANLSAAEQTLFKEMGVPEQRHALNVAYTAQRLAKTPVNMPLLVRLCLLHDVGKTAGDVSIADKVITVLADALCAGWARRCARYGRDGKIANVRHALYVYYHHAAIGAAKLSAAGCVDIAGLVAKHHSAPADDDPPELKYLRWADELN